MELIIQAKIMNFLSGSCFTTLSSAKQAAIATYPPFDGGFFYSRSPAISRSFSSQNPHWEGLTNICQRVILFYSLQETTKSTERFFTLIGGVGVGKRIKFNLRCDGESVRNLEELREHFCVEDVLEYFNNGLLSRWLEVRRFTQERKRRKKRTL